jgi:hypothetical protein
MMFDLMSCNVWEYTYTCILQRFGQRGGSADLGWPNQPMGGGSATPWQKINK